MLCMDGSRVVLYRQGASSQSDPQRPGAGGGLGAATSGPKSKPDASNTRLRVSTLRLSRAFAVEMPCWT
jgi:hypothetical protein